MDNANTSISNIRSNDLRHHQHQHHQYATRTSTYGSTPNRTEQCLDYYWTKQRRSKVDDPLPTNAPSPPSPTFALSNLHSTRRFASARKAFLFTCPTAPASMLPLTMLRSFTAISRSWLCIDQSCIRMTTKMPRMGEWDSSKYLCREPC